MASLAPHSREGGLGCSGHSTSVTPMSTSDGFVLWLGGQPRCWVLWRGPQRNRVCDKMKGEGKVGDSQRPGREGAVSGEGCWDSRTMVSTQNNVTCPSLDWGFPVSTRALSPGPSHQHSCQCAEAFDGSLNFGVGGPEGGCGWGSRHVRWELLPMNDASQGEQKAVRI